MQKTEVRICNVHKYDLGQQEKRQIRACWIENGTWAHSNPPHNLFVMMGDFNFSDNPNESLLRLLARDAPRDHGHLFRPSDAG
eukprot:1522118-Pyramimonas_sp.AAC.1